MLTPGIGARHDKGVAIGRMCTGAHAVEVNASAAEQSKIHRRRL
jgi:hypothetical protein